MTFYSVWMILMSKKVKTNNLQYQKQYVRKTKNKCFGKMLLGFYLRGPLHQATKSKLDPLISTTPLG